MWNESSINNQQMVWVENAKIAVVEGNETVETT
jgi:hypothetical protein